MADDRQARLTLTVVWNPKSRRYEIGDMLWHAPGMWCNRKSAAAVRRAIERVLPTISKSGHAT